MSRGYKWMIIAGTVFAAGLCAGAFAAVKTPPETLYDYFSELGGGDIKISTAPAVLNALLVWAVLFFSAFFRFGAVTTALAVGVRGFTDGYAVTSILRIMGAHGLWLCFFDILGAPVIILMAASVMCALTCPGESGARYLARSGLFLLLLVLETALCSVAAGAVAKAVLPQVSF